MVTFSEFEQGIINLKQVNGINPADVLEIPEPLGQIIGTLIRQKGASLEDLSRLLNFSLEDTRRVANLLINKGYLNMAQTGQGQLLYIVRYARMRRRNIPEF